MRGMPITCRAAVMYEEGKPMTVENVIIDVPKDDQVRIKMVSAGICATDAHFVWGQSKLSEWTGHGVPAVLGHEGAGIVESVGPSVKVLSPGDHVLTTFMPSCRNCASCSSKMTNVCEKENLFILAAEPNKMLTNGTELKGFLALGVYSEYVLVKLSQVVKINPKANLENSCIISCAIATGYYAARNQANVLPGTTAAVWGIGAIGLNAIFGCKQACAKNIIGIDINNDKKGVSEEFGVTEFINPTELNQPLDQYLTSKYSGIDYAFDCIGNQQVVNTALKSLSPCGTFAMVGIAPKGTVITYPTDDLLLGRKICGALMGNSSADEAYSELTEMYINGRYDIDRMVTHKFKLDQINEAFQTLKNGKCIRSLIIFDV